MLTSLNQNVSLELQNSFLGVFGWSINFEFFEEGRLDERKSSFERGKIQIDFKDENYATKKPLFLDVNVRLKKKNDPKRFRNGTKTEPEQKRRCTGLYAVRNGFRKGAVSPQFELGGGPPLSSAMMLSVLKGNTQ